MEKEEEPCPVGACLVMLPGSIVPWIPQDKSDPPKKWVICDGRNITTGHIVGMINLIVFE